MNDRNSLLDKIRALLSKTVENGCSEHEAMAALAKARAMMDAYEITNEDLRLTEEEGAVLKTATDKRDPHDIKAHMSMAVAAFTGTKVWQNREGLLVFCGLRADTDFAEWLLTTLANFVQVELVSYLASTVAPQSDRRKIINGFCGGATSRISARLRELVAASEAAAVNNSRALIVVKSNLISAKMREAGITLGRSRRSSRRINADSYNAGRAAGDRASFGRPIGGAAGTPRIGG
jgi:hypothetical protein